VHGDDVYAPTSSTAANGNDGSVGSADEQQHNNSVGKGKKWVKKLFFLFKNNLAYKNLLKVILWSIIFVDKNNIYIFSIFFWNCPNQII
jgi:hypothetical protein